MEITRGKILGTIIALANAVIFVVAIIAHEGRITEGSLKACVVFLLTLLVPLGLIWFPDEIGGIVGSVGRGGYIDTETPAFLISFMGWFFLFGLPALILFLR